MEAAEESKTGKSDSKYFEEKHKELYAENEELINKLSKKAFRIELKKLKEIINDDSQCYGKDITTYNYLNIIVGQNVKKEGDEDV